MAGAVKPSAVACSTGLNAFLPDANAGMDTHVSQFVRPPAMHGEPVVMQYLCRALRFAFVPVRIDPLGFR